MIPEHPGGRIPADALGEWPGGARLAISFVFAFERWKSDSMEPGRHVGPVLPPDAGVRDWGSASWQDYEGNAGIPRILGICDEFGASGTAIVNTMAVERFPERASEIVERGHEICAHSYSQDTRMWRLEEAEEREVIQRSRAIIQDNTGSRPTGWLSPGGQPSDNTRRLLAECGFAYHSDLVDDDIPYWAVFGERRILCLPYDWEVNDMALYARGLNPPESYLSAFRDKLDSLLEESRRRPMMLSFTAHSRLYGRPAGSMALRRCMEYASSKKGVRFMTREQISAAVYRAENVELPEGAE